MRTFKVTRTTDGRVYTACESCGAVSPRTNDQAVYRWQRKHANECDTKETK